jgi:hypothetical protein
MAEIKEKTEIIPREEIFAEMDKRDEDQILAEIKGKVLEQYVYTIRRAGQDITNLSWAGIKECARRMGHIKILEMDVEEKEDCWICMAKAKDVVNDIELWGSAQQMKTMKSGNDMVIDQFALQKCVSKAQRNALRTLIPEQFIAGMIQSVLDKKKGKKKETDDKKPFTGFGPQE